MKDEVHCGVKSRPCPADNRSICYAKSPAGSGPMVTKKGIFSHVLIPTKNISDLDINFNYWSSQSTGRPIASWNSRCSHKHLPNIWYSKYSYEMYPAETKRESICNGWVLSQSSIFTATQWKDANIRRSIMQLASNSATAQRGAVSCMQGWNAFIFSHATRTSTERE